MSIGKSLQPGQIYTVGVCYMDKVREQASELTSWKIITTQAQMCKRRKMIEQLQLDNQRDERRLEELIGQC